MSGNPCSFCGQSWHTCLEDLAPDFSPPARGTLCLWRQPRLDWLPESPQPHYLGASAPPAKTRQPMSRQGQGSQPGRDGQAWPHKLCSP